MRSHFPVIVLALVLPLAGCTGVITSLDETGDGSVTPDANQSSPDASLSDAVVPGPDSSPDASPDASLQTLTVAFDTTMNGGPYAPANIVAVWVENAAGVFQKTIGRWGDVRIPHLVAWQLKAGQQDQDAISGATRPAHTVRLMLTWDLKNRAGQVVPDGVYTLRMELADSNAAQIAQNRQGTFSFNKNGTRSLQTVSNNGFLNASITYSGR